MLVGYNLVKNGSLELGTTEYYCIDIVVGVYFELLLEQNYRDLVVNWGSPVAVLHLGKMVDCSVEPDYNILVDYFAGWNIGY